jgi:RimJ/RimL family protein N-acetyltransferase
LGVAGTGANILNYEHDPCFNPTAWEAMRRVRGCGMSKTPLPIFKGQNFLLRAASPDDAQFIMKLECDASIHKMFGRNSEDLKPYSPDDVQQWVQRLIKHPCAWVIDARGVIGEVRLDRINMQDRRASFGIGILDPAWLGKGIGTQAAQFVLGYAFQTLHLHRVGLRVLAYNARAIRSYQKCGFVIEGREREAGLVDGEWHDGLIMGILDREFKPDCRGAASS